MQIICEHAATCSNEKCYYITSKFGTIVWKALCSYRRKENHIEPHVNIVEFDALDRTNPNIKFKKAKNGF